MSDTPLPYIDPLGPRVWRTGELQGWQFQIDVIAGGLQISASAQDGDPAVWAVTG